MSRGIKRYTCIFYLLTTIIVPYIYIETHYFTKLIIYCSCEFSSVGMDNA